MAQIFPSPVGLVNNLVRYLNATPKGRAGRGLGAAVPSKTKRARPLKRRPATEISVATLNKAKLDVETKLPSGPYEIPDNICRGLVLRVRPRSITWIFRARFAGKFKTWTVASIANLTAPSKARDRVGEARINIRRGIDPAEWLREQELGGPVERTFDVSVDGWTYEDGAAAYLNHIKNEKRAATHKDYKSCLNPKEFIERIRKKAKRRRRRQGEHSKAAIKVLTPSPHVCRHATSAREIAKVNHRRRYRERSFLKRYPRQEASVQSCAAGVTHFSAGQLMSRRRTQKVKPGT